MILFKITIDFVILQHNSNEHKSLQISITMRSFVKHLGIFRCSKLYYSFAVALQLQVGYNTAKESSYALVNEMVNVSRKIAYCSINFMVNL